MQIDKFFEEEYLIAGNAYDNFIFENCPDEFLQEVKTRLLRSNGEVAPCVVCLDREAEELIEGTINCFENDVHKKILARDIVVALIMREVLKYLPDERKMREFIDWQIEVFRKNNAKQARRLSAISFMPYQVRELSKKIGKIELSFVLDKTRNVYLQQAINSFVSAREPYCVKIFTNNERLCSYYDQGGNIIECPHDFMRRDVNKFIEEQKEE